MILIHFERSEALAEDENLPSERVTVPYDTSEGQWVQLTYECLRSQGGDFLYGLDCDTRTWTGPEGKPFSDIVIEFKEQEQT